MVKLKTKKTQKNSDYDKQIKEILENFDFDYVQELMSWDKARRDYDDYGRIINKKPWEIYINGSFKIPTLSDLRNLASKLLHEAASENLYQISTGPFEVTKRNGRLKLNCVVEQWQYEY